MVVVALLGHLAAGDSQRPPQPALAVAVFAEHHACATLRPSLVSSSLLRRSHSRLVVRVGHLAAGPSQSGELLFLVGECGVRTCTHVCPLHMCV